MANWLEIENAAAQGGQLSRTPEVMQQYEEHKQLLNREGITIEEKIQKILDAYVDYDGVLMFNDYPYDIQPDIVHLVMWMHTWDAVDLVKSWLIGKKIKHIVIINPPERRSVNLPHMQIFVMRRDLNSLTN